MAKMNEDNLKDLYYYRSELNEKIFWYTIKDIEETNNKRVITAMCYTMWGQCYLESPPEYFGEWMVKAGEKLGFPAIESELDKHFEELLST